MVTSKLFKKSKLFFPDYDYTTCLSSSKMKCNSKIIQSNENVNEERCKELCSENSKCKFVRYILETTHCGLFESCNELKLGKDITSYDKVIKNGYPGSTFAKKNANCPGKNNLNKL